MKTFWIVSADHVDPRYAADNVTVTVTEEAPAAGGGFYAVCHPYGCSKTRATEARAILELFHNSGCTNVRMREQ